MHLWLCACVPGVRLMRCECILPSAVVFLRVMVKVDLSTGERMHGWWWQGHISPACPIWFSGLCSTLHLFFLPNLCTWKWGREGKAERKFVLVRLLIYINQNLQKKPVCYPHTHPNFEAITLSACAMWPFSKWSPTQNMLFLLSLSWQHIRTFPSILTFLKEASKPALFKVASGRPTRKFYFISAWHLVPTYPIVHDSSSAAWNAFLTYMYISCINSSKHWGIFAPSLIKLTQRYASWLDDISGLVKLWG